MIATKFKGSAVGTDNLPGWNASKSGISKMYIKRVALSTWFCDPSNQKYINMDFQNNRKGRLHLPLLIIDSFTDMYNRKLDCRIQLKW